MLLKTKLLIFKLLLLLKSDYNSILNSYWSVNFFCDKKQKMHNIWCQKIYPDLFCSFSKEVSNILNEPGHIAFQKLQNLLSKNCFRKWLKFWFLKIELSFVFRRRRPWSWVKTDHKTVYEEKLKINCFTSGCMLLGHYLLIELFNLKSIFIECVKAERKTKKWVWELCICVSVFVLM